MEERRGEKDSERETEERNGFNRGKMCMSQIM